MFLEKMIEAIYSARLALTSPRVYREYIFFKKSQYWEKGALRNYQYKKIKELLKYSYETHPFYKEHFDRSGVHPSDYQSLEDIEKFPTVTKEQLKEGLKKNKFNLPKKVFWHSTSGSSGEPFTFPIDPDGERARKGCKLRTEEWYGKRLGTKWVRLWRSGRRGPKERLIDYALARKIEVTFYQLEEPEKNRLDDRKLQSFINSINRSKAKVIEGYVSALTLLADYALRTNQEFPAVKTVVTGAEYMSPHARQKISDGFGASVFNRYGGTEIGLIAHDDESGNFISMSDRLYFETTNYHGAALSELLITDFTNRAMPFIRYEIGDSVEKEGPQYKECLQPQRLIPLAAISGRVNEFFTMPDGALLTSHVWHVFFRDKLVRNFQVIQKRDNSILVRVIPEQELDERQLSEQLNNLVPDLKLKLELVKDISHEKNGKYRHTFTEIDDHINMIGRDSITPARNINGLEPYIPIADDRISRRNSLKLDWNESTLKPARKLKDALKLAIEEENFINWYPPVAKDEIKKNLADYTGVPAVNIELFPGSDSALDCICKIFLSDGDVVGLAEPTYDQARLTFQIHGGRLKRLNFQSLIAPTFDEMVNQISGNEKIIYVSNPNNPVGNVWGRLEIESLLDQYPSTLFVIDEAYIDFCPDASVVDLVLKYKNIIITRTFSKALGLASLRLGYVAYPSVYEETFAKVVNVKDINSLALVAASAVLGDKGAIRENVEQITQGRKYLAKELRSLGYFVVEGRANFLLVKVKRPAEFVKYLSSVHIHVRDRSKYPGLNGFVRITAGSIRQMERLRDVVQRYDN